MSENKKPPQRNGQCSCCAGGTSVADISYPKSEQIEHHLPPRASDLNPLRTKKTERAIAFLFWLAILFALFSMVAYFLWPISRDDITTVRANNFFVGFGIASALIAIGIGAISWAKYLMREQEEQESRHPVASPREVRAAAERIFKQADEESGFTRRSFLRRSLIAAISIVPLPGILLFRDMYNGNNEDPVALLHKTKWDKGVRLVKDPSGDPIKATDVTIGSVFHVIPETLVQMQKNHEPGFLNEKAKAVVLLVRLPESKLKERPERKGWSYHGIVAYSKVCTHVGCPVALYEQQTHHLLCPCHQSQFDVTDHCRVIFGPAGRPLPQLPITVDEEGYLIAQSDFLEPVGPTFWERRHDYK